MDLKDYIAKLPIEKIIKTEILDEKITLPVEVDPMKFYKDLKTAIKVTELSPEKAIFVASLVDKQPYIDSFSLLTSKLVFSDQEIEMKDKLPKAGKIGPGSGDIDPSWWPNGDGITNIPGGN